MSIIKKIKNLNSIYSADNTYNIECFIIANDFDTNVLTKYEEQFIKQQRNKNFKLFISITISFSVIAIFFFLFSIPWMLKISNKTESSYPIMLIIGAIWLIIMLIVLFIVLVSSYFKIKKILQEETNCFNNLIQKCVIQPDLSQYPESIQMAQYINNSDAWQSSKYPYVNYYIPAMSLARFFSKLKDYYSK